MNSVHCACLLLWMVVSNVILVGLIEKLMMFSTSAENTCPLKGPNLRGGKNYLFQMDVAMLEENKDCAFLQKSTAHKFSKRIKELILFV